MNPEVFACFSRFSDFLNFGWFWDGLTINFDVLAQFPARGWFQIALARNFTSIQIFCSYGVHVPILQVRELGRYCELRPRTWIKLKLIYPSFDV